VARDVLTAADQPVRWLLEVRWGGGLIRVSDAEVDVTRENGEVLHFADAFAELPETEEAVEFMAGNAGQLSVPIRAFFDVEGTTVAQLVAEGHALAGARAELARWVEGTTWEERRPVVVGTISDPEWGDEADPVGFSIETRLTEEAGLTHAPSWRVDGYTWAHADSLLVEHLGVPYPIVFGRPGRLTGGAGRLPTLPSFASVDLNAWIPGSVAVWVDRRDTDPGGSHPVTECRCVVSYGHVTATRVYLCTEDYPEGYRFEVRTGFDELGQPVSFIPWFTVAGPAGAPEDDYDGAYTYSYAGTDTDLVDYYALGNPSLDGSFNQNGDTVQNRLYVGWLDPETDGGGITVDGEEVRTADQVLELVLGFTGLELDRGRIAATRPALASFELAGVIERRVRPWDWVRNNLLPLVPVSVDTGPQGLFWHVWRGDLTATDAVLVIDADSDPDVERSSSMVEDSSQVVNRITLQYAISRMKGTHVGSVTLGADEDLVEDSDIIRSHPACTTSRARFGVRELTLETAIVYSDETAWRVLEALAELRAVPWPVVSYDVPEARYIRARRCLPVAVQDSAMALSARPGVLLGIRTRGDGLLTLTVALRPALRKAVRS